jgi:DNA-binding LytR/AlgR family response regulator
MDKINVLIVEDTASERDALIPVLEANNYNVLGVAPTFKDALQLYNSTNPDVLIIDIFLNGTPDGINFAEFVDASSNGSKPFVFLTSSTDRKIFEKAKLAKPFSYLLKPFNELELLYAIEMAVEKFYNQNDVFSGDEEDTVISDEHLFIKKGKSLKKVLVSDIIYVEVEDKYCNVVTEKEKFVILMSLKKMIKFLNSSLFYQTHRRFVVNIEKIQEITISDNLILLSGGHKVDISDNYRDVIKDIKTLK